MNNMIKKKQQVLKEIKHNITTYLQKYPKTKNLCEYGFRDNILKYLN